MKRALAVSAFKQLFFIESDERNIVSLRAVAGCDPRVEIISGDANIQLINLCQRLDWKNRRGVVFVDPCGPETNWGMLRAIAATKALDVFWLFPLSAVYRNAPHDHGALTPEKRAIPSSPCRNRMNRLNRRRSAGERLAMRPGEILICCSSISPGS